MDAVVTLAHGSGGTKTAEIIRKLIVPMVRLRRVSGGVGLDALDDSAIIPLGDERFLAITIDSYTVSPIFFPGGDIGKLAAAGTINDLAVMGAKPMAIVDAMVVEEGLEVSVLERVLKSMEEVAFEEGVALIGGDFKVMPKGSLDKIMISTAGVGIIEGSRPLLDSMVRPGDKIVVTGTVGEHGAAILAAQLDLIGEIEGIVSDCATVTRAMRIALDVGGVHAAKDPTRGGLASALNEMAEKSGVTIVVDESLIPVSEPVRALCEITGIDPLHLACEGRVVMAVSPDKASELIEALKREGYCEATIIGEAVKGSEFKVLLRSVVGGLRPLEPPSGEVVPRIC